MRAWLASQFDDPTAAGHAYGFLALSIELGKHWATGNAPDGLTLATSLGMIGIAGTMDLVQAFARKA